MKILCLNNNECKKEFKLWLSCVDYILCVELYTEFWSIAVLEYGIFSQLDFIVQNNLHLQISFVSCPLFGFIQKITSRRLY